MVFKLLREPEAATKMAAPELDGPHNAPSSTIAGSKRVRMEAWQRSMGLDQPSEPFKTPRCPPEPTQRTDNQGPKT